MKILVLFVVLSLCSVGLTTTQCDSTCAKCYQGDSAFCLECDTSGDYIYMNWDDYNPAMYYPFGICADETLCDDAGYYSFAGDTTTQKTCFLEYGIPDGFYADGTTDFSLSKCDSTCLTCDGGLATDCLTCWETSTTGKTLQKEGEGLPTGSCVISCPTGYYWDGNDDCIKCHSHCSECSDGSHTGCLACTDTYPIKVLAQSDSISGMCTDSCVYGLLDEDIDVCILYPKCTPGLEREGQKCVPTGVFFEPYCCCQS